MHTELYTFAKQTLIDLIRIPSYSKSEDKTADLLQHIIESYSIPVSRIGNNIIARSATPSHKPCVLLNSHHDTVKPVAGWTTNPHEPIIDNEKIIGLGSNDAGAPLVCLLATFIYFCKNPHNVYDFLFIASAEEEISGLQGIESVLPHIEPIEFGIVGEPTNMRMAIAEKGLLVLDCKSVGIAGHAAHNTGENAIYKAITDIEWFKTFIFPKQSELLGPVKMTVTGIQAGIQHNIIPAECTFMVDIRTNELYTNQEVYEIVKQHVQCEVTPRSFRLQSSYILPQHMLVESAKQLNIELFGSPTMSDQACMRNFPTVKIGPGDTMRSHTADEFIYESEIEQGIDVYIQLLLSL
jgi:acetylornithine deacetylase